MTLNDAEQRQQAIDPTHSYIVQAPAGSGKTELLTQRFLRLLGLVNEPEQIVALTFTRKAANEMRERILAALHLAELNTEATSPHQLQTLNFAKQALIRNHTLGWQLLDQPSRLRIITIDALCQRLSHAIPLQDNQISFPEIIDTPDAHYQEAAKNCLTFVIENQDYQDVITTLLKHVDNRQDTLIALLVNLLMKRDQWVQPLYQAKMQDLSHMESALAFIEQHELTRFKHSISNEQWLELIHLAQRVATIEANPNSLRYALSEWHDLHDLNSQMASSLAALLLTTQQNLRKAFDHHIGLKKGICADAIYNEIKERSKVLLESLNDSPDFLEALLRVKELPEPHYNPEQWEVLQALFTLLPILVAHLNLLFSEHNEVDFTAISQQALEAMGEEDSPTDLALYLDNAIQHLLVDEFQDTSIQQFQLLSKLVNGWQQDDGRTLFVVGDPMQSIYRFRAAEVGLFLRAKVAGIGSVKLTPLQLCCNFRSTETIVHWVNQQFRCIFPQTEDIESGAVPFHPSIHTRPLSGHSHICAQEFANKNDEAEAIIDIIRTESEINPNDSIAILVRSRSQLSSILLRLREEQIPFQGVEIDLLTELPHLRDVWSLTQALLMPAHRLAWLAFLRSPWCGMMLTDLHQLANFNKKKSIYYALSQLKNIPGISDDGRIRAQFIFNVLDQALAKRHQQSLVDWIIDTLNALHLEHILDLRAQDDLEQFWLLLERFEQDGQLADLERFYSQLKKLYSKQVTPSHLQIMTIHKSKGLEFDCVILPGLSQKQAAMDKPLIRWLKLPSPDHEDLLLISPIKAAHHERCLLYDYLGKLDAQKSDYELQRVLYVATTRAKKRLYLTDNKSSAGQSSFRHLLQQEFDIMEGLEVGLEDTKQPLPSLYRLPIEIYSSSHPGCCIEMGATGSFGVLRQPGYAEPTPKLIGVILHAILQWICDRHITSINDVPSALINNHLRSHGLTADLYANIKQQLKQLFDCPIGQWIIAPHAEEHNEYELLITENQDIATRIIDRTFCDKDTRWIIDFKTGHETKDSQKKYREQVNQYAKILSERFRLENNPKTIHCGLYYLASNHWDAWEPVSIVVIS